MIVYAIFVSTNDGRTILSEQFQSIEGVAISVLFGGVFLSLQNMTGVMTNCNTEISSIEIEGLSYHIRSFGLF